jgi:hypothetical protein
MLCYPPQLSPASHPASVDFDMFLGQSFIALLTLALTVPASPVAINNIPATLSFVKHINATGTLNLLKHDQARAKQLQTGFIGGFAESVDSIPITNTAISYLAAVRGYISLALHSQC